MRTPAQMGLSTHSDQPFSIMDSRSMSTEAIRGLREKHFGKGTSLNYESATSAPLHIVAGEGTFLIDSQGNRHLDCVNNVAVLGHAHKKVAQAVSNQLFTLNTNSRYLHGALAEYTQELLATFPKHLQVVYMVNSGSEANDLALRIAYRARPGATHVVVMGSAYHGHTSCLIDLSPYKFWGLGGDGRKPHVHVIPCPDPYRGEYCDGAAAARAAVSQAHKSGGRVAAFFAESILSCGGQIVLPPGYLQGVYDVLRAEGAVCVADEVQCGFGRVGECFWGFETQSVLPDIVTLGKPMGNGYPVSGLVCTRELAESFANGMEYFNTFGGSTAAVVAALTTLRCLKEERRQEDAHKVGAYLMDQLKRLQSENTDLIGDVRGLGLMVGLDIVRDRVSKAHAPATAKWIKERCKAHGVLLSTDGPYDNVIKMKPPLVFDTQHVDILVTTLRHVLSVELTETVKRDLTAKETDVWSRVYGPRMAQYDANAAELGLAPSKPTPKHTHSASHTPDTTFTQTRQQRSSNSVQVGSTGVVGPSVTRRPGYAGEQGGVEVAWAAAAAGHASHGTRSKL